LLFGPDAVIVFVVVTGGGAGLSAGTKPWRRTSWSSSASGRHRCLGGEARWQPHEAVRHTVHPVMRAIRPPAFAGQSRCLSSSPPSASVEDTDDDDDNVNNGGGGLWQRGWRDPAAVAIVVVVDDDGDDGYKCIVEAEQRGRMTKDVVSPTPSSAALFVIRRFHHRAIVNTFAAGRRPLSPTFASRCPIHHLRRSRRWLVVAFSARPAAYQLNHQSETFSSSHIWTYFDLLRVITRIFYL